jgi:hypothetical protein
MRTVLLSGATLALLATATAVQAADVYVPAPRYGAVAPPVYQTVPGLVEAPPPPYAPLPPAVAYPPPYDYVYSPPGYGPQPGWVYNGPPVVAYGDDLAYEVLPPYRVYRRGWW